MDKRISNVLCGLSEVYSCQVSWRSVHFCFWNMFLCRQAVVHTVVCKNRICSRGKSAQNAMKLGRNRPLIVRIKRLKSVCPYLSLLCQYGGGMPKMGTQEEMYYKNLSDRPGKNYTLYNVHRTNIIAYFDLQKSLHFMQNRKIPV